MNLNISKKNLLIIVGAVALLLIIICVGSYNSLVNMEAEIGEGQANIDTQLQRRADLIPNLVTTVQAYADHETEVFAQVNESREKLMQAGSMSEKAEANEELTASLGRLIAIAEAYPELTSSDLYVQLMDELAGTENRIAYAREEYNAVVKSYNVKIRKFPTVLFANMFGFEKAEFFEASAGAQEVPQVNLG